LKERIPERKGLGKNEEEKVLNEEGRVAFEALAWSTTVIPIDSEGIIIRKERGEHQPLGCGPTKEESQESTSRERGTKATISTIKIGEKRENQFP